MNDLFGYMQKNNTPFLAELLKLLGGDNIPSALGGVSAPGGGGAAPGAGGGGGGGAGGSFASFLSSFFGGRR